MRLTDFALLVDADPKWVLNAAAALGRKIAYSLPNAQRLAVARALQESAGIPLPRAFAMAQDALRRYAREPGLVTLAKEQGDPVAVVVDLYRVFAALNTRLSRLRTMHAPRRRGRRPRARRDPVRAAADYGLDLSLLEANLRRTPAQRLRQLDAMVDFRRRVRRKSSA